MNRNYANRVIAAAEVTANLVPMGTIPATERQARPLTVLEPEQQREAWQRAVETATNGKVTAAHVQAVVNEYRKPAEMSTPYPLPAWAADDEEEEEPEEEILTDVDLQVMQVTPRQPRTQREPEPAAPTLPEAVTIHHADARRLTELDIAPVQLVITSPPYNVGIDYATHDDNMTEDEYQDLLYDVFGQCWQVMEEGARLAVVVPFGVGRNPWNPVTPTICTLLRATGFTLRGQIIWDKNTTGNRTSWGSFRLPTNPAIRDTTEAIIVAHKGAGTLAVPDSVRGVDSKGTYTGALADSDYFMELAQDHWIIAPESAQRVGHPAPFPVELAKRLIDFYAYPGAHVLDPFGGSGTTAIAAMRAGCRATLVEIDEEYCRLAKGRVVQ
jgi:site-specific DNA-methyltransferase (adenine-specific)